MTRTSDQTEPSVLSGFRHTNPLIPRLQLRGAPAPHIAMILRNPCQFATVRRCLSTAPPPPPPSGLTKLTSTRRLILLHGPDAPKYLQGVTTTNIPTLSSSSGSYTGFLTAQGRVLYDTFIFPANNSAHFRSSVSDPDDPAFLIECDAAAQQSLLKHIKRYKLRSRFALRAVDPGEWDAWAAWGVYPPPQGVELGCEDQRAPGFGHRMLFPNGSRPEVEAEAVEEERYRLRRILNGVAEGQGEILEGTALPLESNMDYMRGVDFRKGCYVGQELTIRTHHRGVVRKRILPVRMYPDVDGAEVPKEIEYEMESGLKMPEVGGSIERVGGKGRSAGKWLAGVGNVGLALCRLEIMTPVKLTEQVESGFKEGDEFRMVWGEKGAEKSVRVKALVPAWHTLRAEER